MGVTSDVTQLASHRLAKTVPLFGDGANRQRSCLWMQFAHLLRCGYRPPSRKKPSPSQPSP